MTGRYKPGVRLSIRTVARALKVGEMPVREALKRLSNQRALEAMPSRAFRVPTMSPERIAGLFDIRRRLEGYAAAMAVPKMSVRQIERLRAVHSTMLAAVEREDTAGYLESNYAFHFIVYTSCGNVDLVALIETVWVQTGPFLAGILDQYHFTEEWRASHMHIIEAVVARDPQSAQAAIEEDIDWGTKYFLDLKERSDVMSGSPERPKAPNARVHHIPPRAQFPRDLRQ